MTGKIEEGQMLRIRLECLKLAVEMAPPGFSYKVPNLLEELADTLVRYVTTGAMQEPPPVKPRYKPVEVTDAEDLQ